MTEAPEEPRVYFGGKALKAIEWTPMIYMEDYMENLQADGAEIRYIQTIRIGLAHFSNFCDQSNIRHPNELTRTHVLRFQVYLTELRKERGGEPLSLNYRQQLMKYVRGWINWLAELEHIETNPWQRIKIGAVKKVPKPLEPDEVELLFATHRQQAFSIPPFYYHRREVILTLLLGWGLRIHELHYLNVTDMDMRSDWVITRNKGGGHKAMPFGEQIKICVGRYLNHRVRYGIVEEPSLLVDQTGKRLSIEMIRKIVTDLGLRAGVPINPHRLRDTFGTTMLDNDVEVERLMKLMGHGNIKQTLAYSRVNDHKVKESHDRVITPLLNHLLGGELPQ